jgi:glycosyltransferase involved in cell wall biosynthesis
MAAAIERGLTDAAFRDQLRSLGRRRAPLHRWDVVAARTLAALQQLPAPSRRFGRPSSSRLRVALVGPLPPTVSGIAYFNARISAELAQRCELDLLTPTHDGHTISEQIPGVRRFPLTALGTTLNPAAYDAIIYTVGNSVHHHRTFEFAQRYPGIVWLHDVRLHGFYHTYIDEQFRQAGGAQARMPAEIVKWYGDRAPTHVLSAWKWEYYHRYGLGFTQPWVANARAILVNNRLAAHLLYLDQPPDSRLPTVYQLFMPIPSISSEHIVTDDPSRLLVGSFGIVSPIKAPEALMEAMILVRRVVPARLVFIGPIDEPLRRHYEEYTQRYGYSDWVEFVGEVPDEEYRQWLRRVRCAVQLRLTSNGESSAAIADCLSVGLPVVTNMIGAKEEYLPDAVVAIDPALSVEELAQRLIELLTNHAIWQRHRAAALEHARQHTYASLADRLIEIVESLTAESLELHAAAPSAERLAPET